MQTQDPALNTEGLNDQEIFRRQELAALRKMGIEPYPAEGYPVNSSAQAIREGFDANPDAFQDVALAGRLMTRRIMGKASFAELQDATGRIQLYISRDDIATEQFPAFYNDVFKKLISLGDIIGVRGYAFRTQTGELTVHVKSFTLLSKALRPLPVAKEKDGMVYDAFSDPELRYRQRYVDLIVNPKVRETFRLRSQLVNTMRQYMNSLGLLEVETPILQPVYGGALARPFTTHHNTLDMTLYLRIANELYLKRLIVGGFDGVYEFAKDFRNEGMSRFHNPEFTQVEVYVAYKDYIWMMDFVETMVEQVALALHGTTQVQCGYNVIDFKRPWRRLPLLDSIKEYSNGEVDIENQDLDTLLALARKYHLKPEPSWNKAKLTDEFFGLLVEPKLIQPVFITDYPLEMSPLAKKHRSKPGMVERFEGICNGKEICNAYSELNDPLDQRARFEEQLRQRDLGDDEAMLLDDDFLRALEFGMPPTAGLGIGIDRLSMIMTNSASIQDVLFFPLMRPEQH